MNRRLGLSLVALGAVALAPLLSPAVGPTAVAGVPARSVGRHGPSAHVAKGQLLLVGHTDLARTRGGPALGNNGAVALVGSCAFVGRWHDYGDTDDNPGTIQYPIQIVDVSRPSAPRVVGSVPGSTIRNTTARELRAVDLPGFKMLVVQTFGKYLNEGATTAGQHALYFYTFPTGKCAKPSLAGQINLNPIRPHEFYLWLDPNRDHDVNGHPRVLAYVTSPLSGVDGAVVDASDPSSPELVGLWHGGQPLPSASEANIEEGVPAGLGRYSHSISLSPDGTRGYISQWDGGFYTMDTSEFAQGRAGHFRPAGAMSVPLVYERGHPGNTHSAVPVPGSNHVVLGDEIYVTTDGCPFGWMRIADAGTATAPPRQVGEFRLAENDGAKCAAGLVASRNAIGKPLDGTFSMHNQTVTRRFVLASWYGGGLRAVDISDPERPREAGFFVPKPAERILSVPDTSAPIHGATEPADDDWWVATWSYPIVRNGLIYVTDIRSGLYILRPVPGSPLARELAKIKFAEGNSNLGDLLT